MADQEQGQQQQQQQQPTITAVPPQLQQGQEQEEIGQQEQEQGHHGGGGGGGNEVNANFIAEHFQNLVMSDNNSGKPIILDSLHRLENLRNLDDTTTSRVEGSNLDYVATREGDFLHCHLSVLMDFTHGNDRGYKHSFEAAAAISMAAQHMNEGIGWIVPEISGLNERCPIRFTTEFADTEYEQGVALGHVIEMTDRIPGDKSTKPLPCGFIGATRSSGMFQ